MTNGTKNNPIVLNNSNNNKNNLNANEERLKNKYGTRTVQKVKRKMLKNKVQNAKENRQLTEFKYNLAKPLKVTVSAQKSNDALLKNVYGDKMVQKVKRNILKNKVRNAKENRQLTEFKYNLAQPLKIKVSAKDVKRLQAQKKRDDYKELLRKVKFNAPRSLHWFPMNLSNKFNVFRNSIYGKNTPESERVKIYEGWARQLKLSDIKNKQVFSHGLNPDWAKSFVAKLNAEKKAKDNAKAKEKANENARKEERKRERDEKRKKKENEDRQRKAIAGLKKLRKS